MLALPLYLLASFSVLLVSVASFVPSLASFVPSLLVLFMFFLL